MPFSTFIVPLANAGEKATGRIVMQPSFAKGRLARKGATHPDWREQYPEKGAIPTGVRRSWMRRIAAQRYDRSRFFSPEYAYTSRFSLHLH